MPLNPTARYVHTGWGLLGGVGYNFSKHHSAIGEFMWNQLHATDGGLQPLRVASQSRVDGHSNLYVVTGNYRYELRGKVFGSYFIGGEACITGLRISRNESTQATTQVVHRVGSGGDSAANREL